jgi:DNA polymerase/3'-5' exonuclease PolX
MKLDRAMMIAEQWVKRLEPHCERIAIAGSIRRRKGMVKDIEILAIPRTVDSNQENLFGASTVTSHRDPGFIRVFTHAPYQDVIILKGHPEHSKYIRLQLIPEKIVLDLFLATQKNWGYLLAVRTGPAEYSHKVLANRWVKMGYHGESGMLTRGGQPVDVPDEDTLYDLLKMEYVEPENRHFP